MEFTYFYTHKFTENETVTFAVNLPGTLRFKAKIASPFFNCEYRVTVSGIFCTVIMVNEWFNDQLLLITI